MESNQTFLKGFKSKLRTKSKDRKNYLNLGLSRDVCKEVKTSEFAEIVLFVLFWMTIKKWN